MRHEIRESVIRRVVPTRISISDAFDGGNIEAGDITFHDDENGRSCAVVNVRIKPDPYTELEKLHHWQYFSFRATISGLGSNRLLQEIEKTSGIQVYFVIENADQVSYPFAWPGATVCYTDNIADTNSWRRLLGTKYEDGKLQWNCHFSKNGSAYFSYFPSFTYNHHLELVGKCGQYAHVESLGQTHEGREIECVTVGEGDSICWIIHRQHPGEPQAEFFAEGLLNRLLGLQNHGVVDGLVAKLLNKYRFYIVPCMCPDGAVRGHLRTNSKGANLNREWADSGDYKAPTMERSPEVCYVLDKMMDTGCDAFIDVHGDEELPYNFLVSGEDVGNWGPRLAALHGVFHEGYCRANSDMQKEIAYGPVTREESHKIANASVSEVDRRFNCLTVTVEMPVKDCKTNPDPERGWSPHRCRMLGASLLDALARVHPYLRAEGEFWKDLSKDDAYVSSKHPDELNKNQKKRS